MTKFRTAIIAAALFCLFTISLARSPPDLTITTAQVALPLRDDDPALRLSSEPINTDADAKTNPETDPNFSVASSAPMTRITFRPINRLFLKRPCRHHFKFYPTMRDNHQISLGNDMLIASGENTDIKQPAVMDNHQISLGNDMLIATDLKQPTVRDNNQISLENDMLIATDFKQPTVRDNRQISLGNDMLIVSGKNTDFKQPAVRGGGKRIPGRWIRMHRHHLRRRSEDTNNDNEEEVDRGKRVVFKHYDYDRFDREKKLKILKQRFILRNEKEEKTKKSPFFKGVRKFLNNYF
ncbi:hypothetical protein SASPL_148816 [Salvia splendens]|uniref:Uncharacterized protein n=1 Tax=Salvia splendens TaxID=180675 RepID=A0A8X8WAW4_SALSN|nr:hypothetical protein SASPL_148816 [Salvia splendens]